MGATEHLPAQLPLSAAQHGIWLGQQLDPDSPAYWTAEAVELHGTLDVAAFEAALRQAIGEADALHQRFRHDGTRVWQSSAPHPDWTLTRLTLSDAESRAWIAADLRTLPDLEHGPLFATALMQTGPARWLWYLRVHHVALDGFGYALLAQRVAAVYSGSAPPPGQNGLDAVVAEDIAYQEGPASARDRAWWQAYLDGAQAVTLAPPAAVGREVLRRRGQLAGASFALCESVARAAGTDWSALLVAAFAAWLQRETGARDLTIGLPVMNRLGSAAISVPCMAMNIVALRVQVDPQQPLTELARHVAAQMRGVRPHQRCRYEQLKQPGARARLFGPVINLMPFDRPLAFGALTAVSHPLSAGPVEDLALTIAPGAGGIRCDMEANPAAYTDTSLAALHGRLLTAIEHLLAAPDAALATVLGQRPRALLQGAPLAQPPEPVLAALMRHARDTPQRIALEQDGIVLGYGELLEQVQTMAARLQAFGIGAESRVALLLPREPQTIAALLAVLWAGGGYIPLDPGGPVLRIAAVLADAQPSLVVTLRAHAPLAAGVPTLCLDDTGAAPAPMAAPLAVPEHALAYVIYTSGSTGRPNGVMIERAALAHFAAAAGARYGMTAHDRMLQFAPLHFDASVEEIFLPLCTGATLVLRNEAMVESLPRFLAACAERRISVLDLPTAFWHELAYCVSERQAALPGCLRLVIIGGEAALAARVTQWIEASPGAVLLNTYGPTEATVICTTAVLDAAPGTPPIGKPLAGVGIAVVDTELRPVPLGMEGELCLTGPTLARGYLGRPELSAERFTTLAEVDGAPRAYRTGDRALLGEDGQLRYLGRLDHELKISGQRIDPLEIEAALLDYPGMREAAVVPHQGTRLVAFIVAGEAAPSATALRAFLAQRLAPAAVPTTFVTLAQLPRNRNGKIDRKALVVPADAAPATEASPLEARVIAVWREVLGVDAIAPGDDFFALGGKSLQAIQAANRLAIALQREVAVSALFRHPTVAALAQALGELAGHAPPAGTEGAEYAPLLTIQPGRGPALFCIHPAEGLAWCYMGLARHLPHTPIYGLQARGLTGVAPPHAEAMVDDYLALIRSAQPCGPYRLLGWSSGGGVAHALAVRLRAAGESVSLLAMMDAYPSTIWHGKPPPQERDALQAMLDVIGAASVDADGQPLARDSLLAQFRQPGSTLAGASDAQIERMAAMSLHTMQIYRGLRHGHFDGGLLFFHALERGADAPDWHSWAPFIGGRIDKVDIASNHNTMSRPAPLSHIGRELALRLAVQPASEMHP